MTRIVVAGAGAIGCHVGGLLAAARHDVTLLGRDRIGQEIARNGLTLSDLNGLHKTLRNIRYDTDPACLSGADIVLVAVKSGASADIALSVARYAPSAVVVSLQNGISNPATLREGAPDADIRGGVVGFNVVQTGPGAFHRATSGDIWIEDPAGDLAPCLQAAGLVISPVGDIRPVQWGKLLVNLNNALNALSGQTLVAQLSDRNWRRVLAAQMLETLRVLSAAGIAPARFTAAPPALVPHILRLPTVLFRRIAKTMIDIDPKARSSMQDDLDQRRKTEIDALQGEVLDLARQHGQNCPIISNVVSAIRAAEVQGVGPPGLDPRTLL